MLQQQLLDTIQTSSQTKKPLKLWHTLFLFFQAIQSATIT